MCQNPLLALLFTGENDRIVLLWQSRLIPEKSDISALLTAYNTGISTRVSAMSRPSTKVECNCHYCEKPFKMLLNDFKRGRRFCGKACWYAFNSSAIERICPNCNNPFFVQPSKATKNKKIYCCNQCRLDAVQSKRKRNCLYCNTSFIPDIDVIKSGGGKYCSRTCFGKDRSKKVERVCEACSKHFFVKACVVRKGGGRFCSNICFAVAHSGENNTLWRGGGIRYHGLNWKTQSKLARKRDGGICQLCSRKPLAKERQFHVHHIIPYRKFNGDYVTANQLSNLITLCPQCHHKVEYEGLPAPQRLF